MKIGPWGLEGHVGLKKNYDYNNDKNMDWFLLIP